MTNGQDQGQPYEPWQPRQFDPAAHQRRLQGPPQEPPWQQSDPQQGYGQQYPPQVQPWQQQGPRPDAPWQQTPYPQHGPHPMPQVQPWQQPGYGQQPYMPPQPPRKSWPARHKVLTGFLAFCGLVFVIGIAAAAGSPSSPTAAPSTPAAPPAQAPTASAANPAVAHKPSFPPETLADLRAFAATGDASQVHQIGSSTMGLPSCPNPNIYVTVSPALTGKALEADLAAFFVQSGLLGNECQAFVFAYHSKSDYQTHQDDGFTAGRVALTANSGSGAQHNLEVDAGAITGTDGYNVHTHFDFNF